MVNSTSERERKGEEGDEARVEGGGKKDLKRNSYK